MSKILVVEENSTGRIGHVAQVLGEDSHAIIVQAPGPARQTLARQTFDLVILDINLSDGNGLDFLKMVKSRSANSEVIVITAQGSVNLAVEAMRLGAFDFVVKPASRDRLRLSIQSALQRRLISTQRRQSVLHKLGDAPPGSIGCSNAIRKVGRTIEKAARSKATIIVSGESGTGKELCAQAIHDLSGRESKPFVVLNCAAIPRDLLESELFGHIKGAFTGATTDRRGAASTADGGTLFLDEIGELDYGLQAKLLRFLQTGRVQRVGSDNVQSVDVRIICATNRNLRREVSAGRFREDLFYRLNVIEIEMPSLRHRDNDVVLIARHFLDIYSTEEGKAFDQLAPEVEAALVGHSWPGNVRELQNLIRNVVVLNEGPIVALDMLPRDFGNRELKKDAEGSDLVTGSELVPLERIIDKAIESALQKFNGSIPKAAAALGVSPSTIYRRAQGKADRLVS